MKVSFGLITDMPMTEEKIWAKLMELLADTESSSLKVIPTVFGERHLQDAIVTVTGSRDNILQLGRVFRSLCEGIVDNLHRMMPCIKLIESGIKRLVLSGTVLDKNPFIREYVRKVYGKHFSVKTGMVTDSAIGAAKVAAKFLRTQPKSSQ